MGWGTDWEEGMLLKTKAVAAHNVHFTPRRTPTALQGTKSSCTVSARLTPLRRAHKSHSIKQKLKMAYSTSQIPTDTNIAFHTLHWSVHIIFFPPVLHFCTVCKKSQMKLFERQLPKGTHIILPLTQVISSLDSPRATHSTVELAQACERFGPRPIAT